MVEANPVDVHAWAKFEEIGLCCMNLVWKGFF